jgi:hypothetical protein
VNTGGWAVKPCAQRPARATRIKADIRTGFKSAVVAIIAPATHAFTGPVGRALAGHTGGGNALAVGGVEQHDAGAFARGHALQGIAATELDDMRHPGALGVALGKVNHAVRHVAAKNERRIALFEAFLSFTA